jgi:hypothetical protein
MHRENGAPGPLRNGNPRGDPNLAPRCGARSRSGCPCRAPAMVNGRCRMHGGASTGARTEAGRARIAAARTIHGGYGANATQTLRATDAFIAESRAVLASIRAGCAIGNAPAGPGEAVPREAAPGEAVPGEATPGKRRRRLRGEAIPHAT